MLSFAQFTQNLETALAEAAKREKEEVPKKASEGSCVKILPGTPNNTIDVRPN